ncbi:MAG: aminotransferase class I/II-fold pyridoxal phosphate-dependent enzyme [candidate division Zixibacteria bacterium]|nr:aminotransferase class I/II-fold pyridoxal phosphate-dependent enzyme [candidate division Zixibacteria bacterium]
MKKSRAKNFKNYSSLAVHAGEKRNILGSVAQPIFQTSTFVFPRSRRVLEFYKNEPDVYMYTRYGNPTLRTAEEKLARLEGGEDALLFSSGMAAISTAVLSLLEAGDEIVATRNLYGGTLRLFRQVLPKLGVKVSFVEAENVSLAENLITPRTKLFYIESPTNPNLKIVDIRKTAQICRRNKLFSLIDSTFGTPVNQRPLESGIDLVIHSATKYLSGHNDIICGVVIGSNKLVEQVRNLMKVLGGSADPFAAYLLIRGMKTLEVRVKRQNDNSLKLAKYLSRHPKVKRVLHPGLTSHPQHKLAKIQMSGFGGLVCLEVKGGIKMAEKAVDNFKVILNAASLGGVDSLASLPFYTSHHGFSKAELKMDDVTEGMIRLSCGIEDSSVLIEDLRQSLARL